MGADQPAQAFRACPPALFQCHGAEDHPTPREADVPNRKPQEGRKSQRAGRPEQVPGHFPQSMATFGARLAEDTRPTDGSVLSTPAASGAGNGFHQAADVLRAEAGLRGRASGRYPRHGVPPEHGRRSLQEGGPSN